MSRMRVATWCLQNDFTKRPSMSMAVKVLEGVVDAKFDLDYGFLNLPLPNSVARVDNQEVYVTVATPILPSDLSSSR